MAMAGASAADGEPGSVGRLKPSVEDTVLAVADALMPPMPIPDAACAGNGGGAASDGEAWERYWSNDLRASPRYRDAVTSAVQEKMPPHVRSDLLLLLNVLSTSAGCAVLCFAASLFRPRRPILQLLARSVMNVAKSALAWVAGGRLCCKFGGGAGYASWDLSDRQLLLEALRDSPLGPCRQAFVGLKRLLCGIALSHVEDERPQAPPSGLNPYWAAMGYGGPIHRDMPPGRDEELLGKAEGSYDFSDAILDLDREAEVAERDGRTLLTLTYDVVIVGSGCGGGVAAATLAEAGYSVLVCEKGPYLPPEERTNLEADMFGTLYEAGSLLTTEDGNVMLLAGSCLGGGSAVNWGCCLDTPREVRAEWAAPPHGLDHFRPPPRGGSSDFDVSLAAIRKRLGVAAVPAAQHNAMNRALAAGCDAVGYEWSPTGHNYADVAALSAGYTSMGDRYDNKRSGLVTYLADACRDHGARVLPNFAVEKVLQRKGEGGGGAWRATGVLGRVRTAGNNDVDGGRPLEIRANKCVVVSAGSLNTPCLLLKSGLRNWHIGRHLRLHPATAAIGLSSRVSAGAVSSDGAGDVTGQNSGSIMGWLGAPMTTVCTRFVPGPNRDGYGARIECPSAHTGLMGAGLPWKGARQFRELILEGKNAVTLLILQRDRSEGRVFPDASGRPRISYKLGDPDKRSMLDALGGAVRILARAGARYISTGHSDDPGVSGDGGVEDAIVEKYVDDIKARQVPAYTMSVFSAHQMGTCRVGSSPSTSAADEDGELWECDRLYVADASVLPTASGANPMLTTLAMAHLISGRIAARLRHEDGRIGGDEDASSLARLAARREERRRGEGRLASASRILFSPWALSAAGVCAAVLAAWTGLEDLSEFVRRIAA